MNQLEKYVVLAIVVWRITHLVNVEDGPFDIIIKLRKLAGRSFWGKLMDCFYCLSVWTGLGVALYSAKGWLEIIILTFYFSGTSLLIEKITNKNFV